MRLWSEGIKFANGYLNRWSGSVPLLLQQSMGQPLLDYTLYGNTTQSVGTPAPLSPLPITGLDEVLLYAGGTNLLDSTLFLPAYSYVTITYPRPGSVYVSGTGVYSRSDYLSVELKGNTTYYFKCYVTRSDAVNTSRVSIIDPDGTVISNRPLSYTTERTLFSAQISTTRTGTYGVCLYANNGTNNNNNVYCSVLYEDIMLSEEDIPFTPCTGMPSAQRISFPAPLQRIGEAQDFVQFQTQTLIRRIKTLQLDGSESEWYASSYFPFGGQEAGIAIRYNYLDPVSTLDERYPVWCNRFVQKTGGVVREQKEVGVEVSASAIWFCIPESMLTDAGFPKNLNGWNAWVQQNPITLCYVLLSPREFSIEPPALGTVSGTCRVEAYDETSALPASRMDVSYYAKEWRANE